MIIEELENHDRKLCWIYGLQSREFFPDKPWAEVELILQTGWDRVRRNSNIDWHHAKPHVKAGWEDALSLAQGEPCTSAVERSRCSPQSADGI